MPGFALRTFVSVRDISTSTLGYLNSVAGYFLGILPPKRWDVKVLQWDEVDNKNEKTPIGGSWSDPDYAGLYNGGGGEIRTPWWLAPQQISSLLNMFSLIYPSD